MLTCFFGIVNDVNVCNCIAFFKKTTFREKFSTFYKVCWKLLCLIYIDKYWGCKVFNILAREETVKSYLFHTYACWKIESLYCVFLNFFKEQHFVKSFQLFRRCVENFYMQLTSINTGLLKFSTFWPEKKPWAQVSFTHPCVEKWKVGIEFLNIFSKAQHFVDSFQLFISYVENFYM